MSKKKRVHFAGHDPEFPRPIIVGHDRHTWCKREAKRSMLSRSWSEVTCKSCQKARERWRVR